LRSFVPVKTPGLRMTARGVGVRRRLEKFSCGSLGCGEGDCGVLKDQEKSGFLVAWGSSE
jgi:hypothetical protein